MYFARKSIISEIILGSVFSDYFVLWGFSISRLDITETNSTVSLIRSRNPEVQQLACLSVCLSVCLYDCPLAYLKTEPGHGHPSQY